VDRANDCVLHFLPRNKLAAIPTDTSVHRSTQHLYISMTSPRNDLD